MQIFIRTARFGFKIHGAFQRIRPIYVHNRGSLNIQEPVQSIFKRDKLLFLEIHLVQSKRLRCHKHIFHFLPGNSHLDSRKVVCVLERHRRQHFHHGPRQCHVLEHAETVIFLDIDGTHSKIVSFFERALRERHRKFTIHGLHHAIIFGLDIRTYIHVETHSVSRVRRST